MIVGMEVMINKSDGLKLQRTRDYFTYASYVALSLISDIAYTVISPRASDTIAHLGNILVKEMRFKR